MCFFIKKNHSVLKYPINLIFCNGPLLHPQKGMMGKLDFHLSYYSVLHLSGTVNIVGKNPQGFLPVHKTTEFSGSARVTEFAKGLGLDLTDPFACDREILSDLF